MKMPNLIVVVAEVEVEDEAVLMAEAVDISVSNEILMIVANMENVKRRVTSNVTIAKNMGTKKLVVGRRRVEINNQTSLSNQTIYRKKVICLWLFQLMTMG